MKTFITSFLGAEKAQRLYLSPYADYAIVTEAIMNTSCRDSHVGWNAS